MADPYSLQVAGSGAGYTNFTWRTNSMTPGAMKFLLYLGVVRDILFGNETTIAVICFCPVMRLAGDDRPSRSSKSAPDDQARTGIRGRPRPADHDPGKCHGRLRTRKVGHTFLFPVQGRRAISLAHEIIRNIALLRHDPSRRDQQREQYFLLY